MQSNAIKRNEVQLLSGRGRGVDADALGLGDGVEGGVEELVERIRVRVWGESGGVGGIGGFGGDGGG